MDPTAIVSGLSGLAGLFGGNKTPPHIKKLIALLDAQTAATRDLMAQARMYNPAEEDKMAVEEAQRGSAQAIGKGLRMARAETASGGATPGDTDMASRGYEAALDSTQGIKPLIAQLRATRAQRKMDAMRGALSVPTGQLMQGYLAAGEASQGAGIGSSLKLIADSVNGIHRKRKDPPAGSFANYDQSFKF